MSLPKRGSVLLSKNLKTGSWERPLVLLGSRSPRVFLLDSKGQIVEMSCSHVQSYISSRRMKMEDDDGDVR